MPEGCRIALLGLPDDTGVALNGGRMGAKDGPRAFREALAQYGTTTYIGRNEKEHIDLDRVGVFDAGDVEPVPGGTVAAMEQTHDRITARVRELLDANLLPVCIGGGHDLTWPAVRAVAEKFPDLAGVYFDAHLDVREEPGSGMAFRKILSETTCRELIVEGLDPFANSREHLEWFTSHGGILGHETWSPSRDVRAAHMFASVDLDSIKASDAPGVSAINVAGFDARFVDGAAARFCGELQHVVYFDIMELNPKYDIDGRTARLAARLFLSFVAGFASRATR